MVELYLRCHNHWHDFSQSFRSAPRRKIRNVPLAARLVSETAIKVLIQCGIGECTNSYWSTKHFRLAAYSAYTYSPFDFYLLLYFLQLYGFNAGIKNILVFEFRENILYVYINYFNILFNFQKLFFYSMRGRKPKSSDLAPKNVQTATELRKILDQTFQEFIYIDFCFNIFFLKLFTLFSFTLRRHLLDVYSKK